MWIPWRYQIPGIQVNKFAKQLQIMPRVKRYEEKSKNSEDRRKSALHGARGDLVLITSIEAGDMIVIHGRALVVREC